jgi:hypothetical protein
MPLKPETRGIFEQHIDRMVNQEFLIGIEDSIQVLRADNLIAPGSRRDTLITAIVYYLNGSFASVKEIAEPEMTLIEFRKEMTDIIRNRGPQIRDAVLTYLQE